MRFARNPFPFFLLILSVVGAFSAIDAASGDPVAEEHYKRANQLKREGQFLEAEREYQLALEVDPTFDHASYNLGNLYFAQKRYTDAIQAYEKVIALNPAFRSAYYNLGLAYKFAGKGEQAVVGFGDAVLAAGNERIVDSLSQLKDLLPTLAVIDTSASPEIGLAGLPRPVMVTYRWKNAMYGRPYFFSLAAPDLCVLLAERGRDVLIRREDLADAELLARLRGASRVWKEPRLPWNTEKAKMLLREGRLKLADGSIVLSNDADRAPVRFTIDVAEKYWEYKNSILHSALV